MKAFSKATQEYLSPPSDPRFRRDKVHLSVTKSTDKTLSHFITDFYNPCDLAPEGKRYPCRSTLQWAQQFPEGRHLTREHDCFRLELPITDMVVERIDASFEPNQIEFADDETHMMYKQVLIRGIQADRIAEITAEYKTNNKIPNHSYEFSAKYPLTDYQQVSLYNGLSIPGYGYFKEQGVGKTAPALATICNLAKNSEDMIKGIIVCPKNVRSNWVSELKKFSTQPGKTTILHGGPLNRVKQVLKAVMRDPGCKFSLIICSYETISRSWNAIEQIMDKIPNPGFDISILDEGHYIKNSNTIRYKTAQKLRDISKKRLILTGTPITNTPLDLYTQLEFLGKGYSGFYSYRAFKRFFGRYEQDFSTGRDRFVGVQNIPFMQERLARYSFIARQEEVQKDLPDRVYDIIDVEMSKEQRELYLKVRDEIVIEAENSLENSEHPKQMIISNILTQMLKLAQITSGYISWSEVLDEDGNVVTPRTIDRIDPDNKLEELVRLLKTKKPTDKTIIWSCWVQNIKTISARLKLEGIDCVTYYGATKEADREAAKERFNCDPNCTVFIGNPVAGGTGLNLLGYPPEGHEIYEKTGKTPDDFKTNCNHVIYYSQNWSSTARSQSEKRCHRRGTREPVRVTDLVVPNTIDSEIREVVLLKQKQALEISDLRKILDNIISGELIND